MRVARAVRSPRSRGVLVPRRSTAGGNGARPECPVVLARSCAPRVAHRRPLRRRDSSSSRRFDQLDERPSEQAQVVVHGRALGRRSCVVVVGQTVVQQAVAYSARATAPPRPSLRRRRHWPGSSATSAFVTAPGGNHERGVRESRLPLSPYRVSLVHRRRGRVEVARVHLHTRSAAGGNRKLAERADVLRKTNVSRRELMPRFVVPNSARLGRRARRAVVLREMSVVASNAATRHGAEGGLPHNPG